MNYQDFIIDPKDAQRILLGAKGTLSPMEFAQGLVALVIIASAGYILPLLPVIGIVFSLLSIPVFIAVIFSWICIFSKRFHDAGKSGWLAAAAFVVSIIVSGVIGKILSPIFGVAPITDFAALQAAGAAMAWKNVVGNLLMNAVLGFAMFRMASVKGVESTSGE